MSNIQLPIAIVLATLLAATAWAAENAPAESSPEMPMMQHGGMMTPEAMMQMMAHRNQQMQMMHPQMMQMMPHMGYGPGSGQAGGYHHGMGSMMNPQMMGGGMGTMMNPQMMGGGMGTMMHPQMMGGGMVPMMNPQMMQMRMQHMHNMEQRLKNIEALLQQLVDQGKAG